MAPNARPIAVENDSSSEELRSFLDKKADTNGLSQINDDNEDWTDVKHSERKKRDRILDDGVLFKLMKKSLLAMLLW